MNPIIWIKAFREAMFEGRVTYIGHHQFNGLRMIKSMHVAPRQMRLI